MFRKLICLLLAMAMAGAPLFAGGTVSASQEDYASLEAAIEKQIRAFADSIDQNKADANAATALAKHGLTGKGKTLTAGKTHPLTATLLNSEMVQEFLIVGCSGIIDIMEETGETELMGYGWTQWLSTGYSYEIHALPVGPVDRLDSVSFLVSRKMLGTPNGYDASLEWITGVTNSRFIITRQSATKDFITYNVQYIAKDTFDFTTTGTDSNIPQAIASILGSILFRPFKWEATATFQLKLPNSCDHSFEAKATKPTCTAQGYTTYTCAHCGYSYQGDKTKATGHSYGDWTVVTAPTCTEGGEEQRTCKTCKEVEARETAAKGHDYSAEVKEPTCTEPGYTTFTCACGDSYVGDDTAPLGHSFEDRICTVCGELEYTPGDVDLDDDVDVDDVLALLWNVLFPEEYPIAVPADFDGNGVTDVDDVLKLLWFVLFPEDYPLN